MRKVLLLALLSSFIFADGMMGGWNNSEETKAEKAQKKEKGRMCTLYTKKIAKYKETMRNDELAQATLKNYVRLQEKYCENIVQDKNTSN